MCTKVEYTFQNMYEKKTAHDLNAFYAGFELVHPTQCIEPWVTYIAVFEPRIPFSR